MTKSLLMGMAVCAAMAFTGSAYAYVKHPVHKHTAWAEEYGRSSAPEYGRQGYPTKFRIPAHPAVWDCVHVLFPQCSRGYDGLNDGSYQ